MTTQSTKQDSRRQYASGALSPERQDAPGLESEMTPHADHSEKSYRGSGRLQGKVAVITGADSGISRAVAIAFAREGADVVMSYLNEDAATIKQLVEEAGRQAVTGSQQAIQRGIRVNAVAPSPVWTPLIPSTMSAEQVKDFGKSTPVGRVAQPAELAPAYVFLASQESSFITGEVIGVTGGSPVS